MLGSAAVNGLGVATLVTFTLPLGTDTITASYSATPYYLASTSNAVVVTIGAATTAIALTLTQ